ncbi:stage III sporulation protein SpoIIIAB [Alkalicoccobacillus porphyridii]|uniref:Stage III sporulation protein SpoAB n=1 Tax=Alkalicoccobacillus porphyridii TaxID=2597270 RepID=A0A553ZV88_9BACI|nr:stage III sporulation protein SpoIIIAB [Alkalicoccobacillus porphyridii]TSB45398.1 stage III sporulation protein SpoAB [Alkalicoccobacillus porphyridii]
MKWFGAILIILTCTWLGFDAARRVSDRPKQLRQLKTGILALEAEMLYGLTPLQEASAHLSTQLAYPINVLFERFSSKLAARGDSAHIAWEESLDETWEMTSLSKGEREVLRQFGQTLGQHDRDQQEKQIKLTMVHLDREEAEAKENQLRYETMLKSLGFLGGLLIVILML